MTDVVNFTTFTLASDHNIAPSPWFFTRGGVIDLRAGSMRLAGNAGWYWSATASTDSDGTYFFGFDADNIYPSRSANRWFSFPVRCVTTGSPLTSTPLLTTSLLF